MLEDSNKIYDRNWKGHVTLEWMKKLVNNTRGSMKGNDVFWKIEETEFWCIQDGKSFVQCVMLYTDIKRKLPRIIVLGHETLMSKMRGRKHHFYDGTFRITPHPFAQVWIVVIFSDGE